MISLEEAFLAALQGLAEWWPISSSAVVTFTSLKLGYSIEKSLDYSLALHLGSGLAIILVFKRDLYGFFRYSDMDSKLFSREIYLYSLIISFLTALPLYLFFRELGSTYGSITLLVIGFGLLVTSFVLKKSIGFRKFVSNRDMLITGLLQGVSVLPGFSRKGLTTGYLIVRNYKPEIAVKISFLLGAPALIAAGIYGSYMLIEKNYLSLSSLFILQLLVFILSVASAKSFLKFSERVDVRFFTFTLALFIIISVFLESIG